MDTKTTYITDLDDYLVGYSMNYLEELNNEYDNIEDVAREQGIEFDTLAIDKIRKMYYD